MIMEAARKARKPIGMSRVAEDMESQIRTLAYQLWLGRGAPIGSPEEDWFKAEARLTCSESPKSVDQYGRLGWQSNIP